MYNIVVIYTHVLIYVVIRVVCKTKYVNFRKYSINVSSRASMIAREAISQSQAILVISIRAFAHGVFFMYVFIRHTNNYHSIAYNKYYIRKT